MIRKKSKVKKPKLRLISLEQHDAAMNMAIDEALTEQIGKEKSIATLRFYTWKPAAISIGYFQSLQDEVDIDKCKQQNIDIVRRITGGGAVLHDKEITYSLIIPQKGNIIIDKDIIKSYQHICNALIIAFKQFALNAEFVPINDILINGKKISGNAQTRKNNCVLQHGTILLEVDVDQMFSLLKVPDEKMKGKLISQVKERIISMKQLGKNSSLEKMQKALAKGFSQALDIELQESSLSKEELERALYLKKTKYLNKSWIEMK